ncbi:MAG: ankyrin repeat domain-containing protein [Myxococcaceae bacterium]
MFRITNICLVIAFGFSAFALRDFGSEYTPARQKILKSCAAIKANCKLTPLHLAVLNGDLPEIQNLANQGADLNATARQKWTPAHFATLHSDRAILDILYSLGADENALDSNRATPKQLWNLTHIEDSYRVNIWDENTQSVQQIDSTEFTRLTGARFIESLKMSPQTLAVEWLKGFPVRQKLQQALAFVEPHQALANQDHVYLKKMPGIAGYGLYALRDFQPGEIVGEYQGEWVGKKSKVEDNEYATQEINAAHLRGYVAFSAHGLPNAYLTASERVSGLRVNELLVVGQPIRAHQPIMWNYLTHDVVWKNYQEQLSDVLDEYVSQNGLQLSHHNDMILYVYTTPSVFFRLLFEDKISKDDLAEIIKNKKLIQYSPTQELLPSYTTLQTSLEDYLDRIKRLDGESQQNLKRFLALKAREGNIPVLMTMLWNIETVCVNSNQDSWLTWIGWRSHEICDEFSIGIDWYTMWNEFCKQSLAPGLGNCEELRNMVAENREL